MGGGQALETLVLRAWVELASEHGLRVRVVQVSPGQAERPVLATTSVDDVCTAVRDWLLSVERQADQAPK
jgi:hypothetical protein